MLGEREKAEEDSATGEETDLPVGLSPRLPVLDPGTLVTGCSSLDAGEVFMEGPDALDELADRGRNSFDEGRQFIERLPDGQSSVMSSRASTVER